MTRYAIELSAEAVRTLRKLDNQDRVRVVRAIDALAAKPRPAGVKMLSGHHGYLRIRAGQFRVIYTVDDGRFIVLVLHIGHRREVYDLLR